MLIHFMKKSYMLKCTLFQVSKHIHCDVTVNSHFNQFVYIITVIKIEIDNIIEDSG